MNILVTTSATVHASLTHRALSFAAELSARGHSVELLAPRYDKYSRHQPDMPNSLGGVQLSYPWHPNTSSPLGLLAYALTSSWLILTRKPDVVLVFKPTPISITGFLAKLRGARVVADFDDLGEEVMQREGQPRILSWLVGHCEQLAAQWANGLVVASKLLESELGPRHHKPIVRLSNGVNLADWQPTPADGAERIVFFGGLGRVNLLDTALEAIAQIAPSHPNLEVSILGDGPARAELEAFSNRLGLSKNVTFHGWTRPSAVAKFAHAGDIALCIMPDERTTAACSNQKVFQYAALNLCVVASNVGDLPDYLDNGRAGEVVPAEDVTQLATTLESLLASTSHRRKLAAALAERTQARYTWTVLASQLETLLRTVLGQPSSGAHHDA